MPPQCSGRAPQALSPTFGHTPTFDATTANSCCPTEITPTHIDGKPSKSPHFAYFWNVSDVSKYILKLSRLKVDRSHGAPAPHKAILLISVLQSILEGQIKDNRIAITPELVARFKDNWSSALPEHQLPVPLHAVGGYADEVGAAGLVVDVDIPMVGGGVGRIQYGATR